MTEPIKLPPLPHLPLNDPAAVFKTVHDWGRAAIEADRQARGEPVAWTLTQQQVMALAEEMIVGASALGGMDDDGIECDVRLMVRMPGTVADDDGKLNERPILAICLEEYPEEGVYPIDPANCETEHTTPHPQQIPEGYKQTLNELLACCLAWEPDTKILGNVRAQDAADAIRAMLESAPEPKEKP